MECLLSGIRRKRRIPFTISPASAWEKGPGGQCVEDPVRMTCGGVSESVFVSCRSLRYIGILCLVLFFSLGVSSQNLLVDGGFGLSGHQPEAAVWISRGAGASIEKGVGRPSSDNADETAYAARLMPPTDYASEWVQPLLPLTTGNEYVLSAWVRLQGDTPAQASLGVRMQNGYPRIYRGLSGDGWERIELAFTASEGWAQVVLSCTAEAMVFWDDVALYASDTVMERLAGEWEARLKTEQQPLYTGLVIDARGTGLERGMSPKIYDAFGRLVFAGESASYDQLIRKGIVAYVRSLEEATAHPRVAVNPEYPLRLPLVLDAQQATGSPPTAVIVGEEDGRRIRRATDQYDFLGRFAIVFVVD